LGHQKLQISVVIFWPYSGKVNIFFQFYVQVLRTDVIELEVRDRFDRGRPVLRRFLGKLDVPVYEILERLNCRWVSLFCYVKSLSLYFFIDLPNYNKAKFGLELHHKPFQMTG